MNNSDKIAKLKKALKSPTTPESLKGQLQKQIDLLEKEVVDDKKPILPSQKPNMPKTKQPKVGSFVKVSIGYGNFHFGKIKKDYTDENFYVGDQNGYEVTGIGDRLKPNQIEVITEAEYKKNILPNPKINKPKVARSVKSTAKKYYSNREIKSVSVLENGKQVTYKASDLFDGASFLEKGGKTDEIIELYPLQIIPLSTQLQKITGDSLNTSDYSALDGSDYSTNPNEIILHKSSGKKFKMPMSIYNYVDGYNLVHNIFQKKITVYETGALVAEIKDNKLDFTNKDKSVIIDRTKVRTAFENGFIPDSANANNFYKDVEQKLFFKYAKYEDVEDNKESSEAKKLQAEIKELEDIQHKLERKYEKGGKLSDKSIYVPFRNVVEIELLDGSKVKPANGYHIKKGAKPIQSKQTKKAVSKEVDVTAEKALELLKAGKSIRIRGYGDDDKNFTGVGIDDYDGWEDDEIIETLKEYPQLQFWGEKYELGGNIPYQAFESYNIERLAYGGEVGVDLFEDYEQIPPEVQEILDRHSQAFEDGDYEGLQTAWNEVNAIGYTFDYYVDGQAYDLRKIGQKGKVELAEELESEQFEKGGQVFDYKQKYDKTKIKSVSDVKQFFKYLNNTEKLVFHPDDNFLGNMEDHITKKQAINLDRYMLDCWEVCEKEKKDIYQIAIKSIDAYAKGGWTKDHTYLNKSENYEVRYAKGKSRKEYKANGGKVAEHNVTMISKLYPGEILSVEKKPNGVYTIFSESPDWEKRDEYPDGFQSIEDAILVAKANAGYTKEFEKGGPTLEIEPGDIVKYSNPTEGERKFNFVVKEVNHDESNPIKTRVLMTLIDSQFSIPPTELVRLSDVELVHKMEKSDKTPTIGRKAKGVSLDKIAEMHGVTKKYLQKQIEKGQKVELEHTTDEAIAYAIAKDHLYENPDYYILLNQIEMKADGGQISSFEKTSKILLKFKDDKVNVSEIKKEINQLNKDSFTQLYLISLNLKTEADSDYVQSRFSSKKDKEEMINEILKNKIKNYKTPSEDINSKLESLKNDFKENIIDEVEYKQKRKDILNQIEMKASGGEVENLQKGNIFEGIPNSKYENSSQLMLMNQSYILKPISKNKFEVVAMYDTPLEAISARDKNDEWINYKIHHTKSLLTPEKDSQTQAKPKRAGSKIFDKAKEIREPGEKWQEAVRRANLLLKK